MALRRVILAFSRFAKLIQIIGYIRQPITGSANRNADGVADQADISAINVDHIVVNISRLADAVTPFFGSLIPQVVS